MFGRKESIVFKPASVVSLTLLHIRLGLKKWLIRAQNLFTTGQSLATGAKAKLALCAQTFTLAAVAPRGHGARKKLNSHFMSHFVQLFYHS